MVMHGLTTWNVVPDARNGHIIMAKKSAPKTTPASATPTVLDRIVKIARTVTPATIIEIVRTANRDHGVTARNVGRYTNTRIMAFQNASFVHNTTWQLDDVQLLALWAMEFPAAVGRVFAVNGRMGTPDMTAVRDGIGIIRGVRSDYNTTGHGDPTGTPAIASTSYGTKRFDVVVPESNAAPAPVADTKKKTVRASRTKKNVAA